MKQTGTASADASNTATPVQWETSSSALSEEQWTSVCAARLFELRPASERQVLRDVAADMARTLRYFDPGLAAEMEHEGGMLDD